MQVGAGDNGGISVAQGLAGPYLPPTGPLISSEGGLASNLRSSCLRLLSIGIKGAPLPFLELVEGVAQPECAQHDKETEHGRSLARVRAAGAASCGHLNGAGQEAGVERRVKAGVGASANAQQAGQG